MMNKSPCKIACAHNETSRPVSWMLTPTFDLNHWRFSSTSEISEMGAPQMSAARSVNSSKTASGTVSRMSYCQRTLMRLGSFFGMGVLMVAFRLVYGKSPAARMLRTGPAVNGMEAKI